MRHRVRNSLCKETKDFLCAKHWRGVNNNRREKRRLSTQSRETTENQHRRCKGRMLLNQEKLTAGTNYTKIRRGGEGEAGRCPFVPTKGAREVACNDGGGRKAQKEKREKDEKAKRYSFTTSQIVETWVSEGFMRRTSTKV